MRKREIFIRENAGFFFGAYKLYSQRHQNTQNKNRERFKIKNKITF